MSFNDVNDILELFKVLVPASFATSKAALKSDLYLRAVYLLSILIIVAVLLLIFRYRL